MDEKLRNLIFVHAKKWVLEAGEEIRQSMYGDLSIETKSSPDDLVTSLDKQTERFLVHNIRESFPTHFILGEEGYGDDIESLEGTTWIIDPIDGTMNFVH
ncbi:MAG TPA: inositol monophosphatase family protein, partial [Pseudogracilibacillus sp.]|nr:inositol monophosphatase family protein [Pseudogracilibacillus sp.]